MGGRSSVGLVGLALLLRAGCFGAEAPGWKLVETIPLRATLHHVQGIDVADGMVWVSSVDRATRKGWVSKFRVSSGELVKQVEVQDGERFHPGGLTLDGDSVWVPVAEYHRGGPTTVQRRNRETLALVSGFDVKDHIGCVAAGPDYLVGGNWDSRILYRWSKSGVQESARANPRVTSYQDIKIVSDGVVAGSGNVSAKLGAVEWVRVSDLTLVRRVEMGPTDRGVPFTHEGMTIRGGRLYLLPEDDPSRLFVFAPAE